MKWSLIAVGKPALSWAKDGAADYLARLQRTQRVECVFVRDGSDEQVAKRVPAGRVGIDDDMAAAAVYLASRAGDYVVGTTLTVDGGINLTR